MSGRRVLICGERDWAWRAPIVRLIETLNPESDKIIHGAARGADNLADRIADDYGISRHAYPADWMKFGKAAGPIRNKLMADEGNPTEVWAFKRNFDHSLRRGGTENMVKLARERGLPVTIIESVT